MDFQEVVFYTGQTSELLVPLLLFEVAHHLQYRGSFSAVLP